MRRAALLLASVAACTIETHAPNVSEPTCFRVPIAEYTAPPDTCIRLVDANGLTLFRRAESTSCGGPDCLVLAPGETAYALAKVKPGPEPTWRVEVGDCDPCPT